MGPRLLRNFVKDRGNQFTLGAFLGTFSYALMVLRSVRTQGEGPFVPHAALTAGILLAFLCVGVLVFFVGHMAGRINVDTVIELVSEDVAHAIRRLTGTDAPSAVTAPTFTDAVVAVADPRRGYLQELDADQLADWAAAHDCTIQLLVRPGDYVFPGAPIALVEPGTRRHRTGDPARHRAWWPTGQPHRPGVRGAPARRDRGARAVAGDQRSAYRDERARPAGGGAVRHGRHRHAAALRGRVERNGRSTMTGWSMCHLIRSDYAAGCAFLITHVPDLGYRPERRRERGGAASAR